MDTIRQPEQVALELAGVVDDGIKKTGLREMSLILKDANGNTYRAGFLTRTIYDEQMKKAFRRMIPYSPKEQL